MNNHCVQKGSNVWFKLLLIRGFELEALTNEIKHELK